MGIRLSSNNNHNNKNLYKSYYNVKMYFCWIFIFLFFHSVFMSFFFVWFHIRWQRNKLQHEKSNKTTIHMQRNGYFYSVFTCSLFLWWFTFISWCWCVDTALATVTWPWVSLFHLLKFYFIFSLFLCVLCADVCLVSILYEHKYTQTHTSDTITIYILHTISKWNNCSSQMQRQSWSKKNSSRHTGPLVS